MATVYILYSNKLDRFYTGSCFNFKKRLEEHKFKKYKDCYTAKVEDWKVFFEKSNLSYQQARNIENHIKKMKSKIYIRNLKKYPDIFNKLVAKYQ